MSDPTLLLPDGALPIQEPLSGADLRMLDVPVPIVEARDPMRAPESLLPYLAWERSVDVWDPAWPVATRRTVVAASYDVHRHKGTRYAVETALQALGVAASITEWWETLPRGLPYTFHVRAYVAAHLYDGGPVIDDRVIAAIRASVRRAKGVARSFTLDVAARITNPLALAGALHPRVYLRAFAHPPPTVFGVPLGVAAAARPRAVARIIARGSA